MKSAIIWIINTANAIIFSWIFFEKIFFLKILENLIQFRTKKLISNQTKKKLKKSSWNKMRVELISAGGYQNISRLDIRNR